MKSLVDALELDALLRQPSTVVVDCRTSLGDPDAGRRAYEVDHVPGAVHADLARDLSGPVVPGHSGRHPWPHASAMSERLGRWGTTTGSAVVAYDDAGGAFAARLWWILRWLGHDAAAVLDGGFAAWRAAGLPVSAASSAPVPRTFVARLRPELLVDTAFVESVRGRGDFRLIDARAEERFTGAIEPIDKVAGHIPGARSLPYAESLDGGRFRSSAELRIRLRGVLGEVAPERGIVYCGSGVTACHHLLAAEQAGIEGLRLYAGSFSEWIADGRRPVETGKPTA